MSKLSKGDSVVVKPGVIDPDFDIGIGGWQGRIIEIAPAGDQGMVMVAWDSLTLRDMPNWTIEKSMVQGLAWTKYRIKASEVALTTPRDTEEDVALVVEELSRKFAWSWLGEEGSRINHILSGVDPNDERALFRTWETYLRECLDFPFEAEIFEAQRWGPFGVGDRVRVQSISLVADLYGIIVEVRLGRRKYDLPLCDLEVVDKDSPNYQPVNDYSFWFANR